MDWNLAFFHDTPYASVVLVQSERTFNVTNNMAAEASVIINLIPFPATNEVTNQTSTHNNEFVSHNNIIFIVIEYLSTAKLLSVILRVVR